jgi:AraC-like DNA-binding protein
LPDGCIDAIVVFDPGSAPVVRASPLMDAPTIVDVPCGRRLVGARLFPGTRIDPAALRDAFRSLGGDPDALFARTAEFASLSRDAEEVLDALARDVRTVDAAARSLGVSLRTLQRVAVAETGRAPDFWRRLSRARRAARAVADGVPPVAAAADAGFADQAHLTREFRRWFGVATRRIRSDPEFAATVRASGYG